MVQLVAGPRTSVSADEGFALALTETGVVYSWGKGHKGRLGHQGSDNQRAPRLVEGLSSVDVVMVRTRTGSSMTGTFCILALCLSVYW